MFNDKYKLTKAVLEGRKTMTRRLMPENVIIDGKVFAFNKQDPHEALRTYILSKATYKVGDIVAIAQGYIDIYSPTDFYSVERAQRVMSSAGWLNKMFVRAEDMPHRIRITDVKAEHLQEISDDDCLKEGIFALKDPALRPLMVYSFIGGDVFDIPQAAFRSLFAKTTGKPELWDMDGWVYVYEFELVS